MDTVIPPLEERTMAKQAEHNPTSPYDLVLAHPSYQPTKEEKEEPIEFPEGTTPEDLARALMQPVGVRYVNPRKQRS